MILHILYLVAITAEAMTAALVAGRRQMDWFGVCVVASITALGGGTVRDILIDRHPLSWIEHPEYLLITVAARSRWHSSRPTCAGCARYS